MFDHIPVFLQITLLSLLAGSILAGFYVARQRPRVPQIPQEAPQPKTPENLPSTWDIHTATKYLVEPLVSSMVASLVALLRRSTANTEATEVSPYARRVFSICGTFSDSQLLILEPALKATLTSYLLGLKDEPDPQIQMHELATRVGALVHLKFKDVTFMPEFEQLGRELKTRGSIDIRALTKSWRTEADRRDLHLGFSHRFLDFLGTFINKRSKQMDAQVRDLISEQEYELAAKIVIKDYPTHLETLYGGAFNLQNAGSAVLVQLRERPTAYPQLLPSSFNTRLFGYSSYLNIETQEVLNRTTRSILASEPAHHWMAKFVDHIRQWYEPEHVVRQRFEYILTVLEKHPDVDFQGEIWQCLVANIGDSIHADPKELLAIAKHLCVLLGNSIPALAYNSLTETEQRRIRGALALYSEETPELDWTRAKAMLDQIFSLDQVTTDQATVWRQSVRKWSWEISYDDWCRNQDPHTSSRVAALAIMLNREGAFHKDGGERAFERITLLHSDLFLRTPDQGV